MTAHPKNDTPFKSLDKIAADPRVELVFDEGDDGIWIWLNPGSLCGDTDTHCVHEWTVRDVIRSFRTVQPCDLTGCDFCNPVTPEAK